MQQKEFLIGEVNHRVQNSLQLVSSFLSMQARASDNPELHAALKEAGRRLIAVALVHRRLYRGDQIALVDGARYIEELCADTVSYMGQEWAQHLSLHLSPVLIATDRAIILGLVLTELMINANKYAYGGAAGPIDVELIEDRTSSVPGCLRQRRRQGRHARRHGLAHHGGPGRPAGRRADFQRQSTRAPRRDQGAASRNGQGTDVRDAMTAQGQLVGGMLAHLRTATRPAHDTPEGGLGLLGQHLGRAADTDILARMYGFRSGWQPQVAALFQNEPFLRPRRRLHLLAADLAALGVSAQALSALPVCPLTNLRDDREALGSLYVMEGSTLGGRIIRKNVERCLGDDGRMSCSYRLWRRHRRDVALAPGAVGRGPGGRHAARWQRCNGDLRADRLVAFARSGSHSGRPCCGQRPSRQCDGMHIASKSPYSSRVHGN